MLVSFQPPCRFNVDYTILKKNTENQDHGSFHGSVTISHRGDYLNRSIFLRNFTEEPQDAGAVFDGGAAAPEVLPDTGRRVRERGRARKSPGGLSRLRARVDDLHFTRYATLADDVIIHGHASSQAAFLYPPPPQTDTLYRPTRRLIS